MALIASAQQTIAVEKSRKRASRISPSRKAEQVDSVSVVICLHKVAVRIQHVIFEARAKRKSTNLGQPAPEGVLHGRIAHRANARMVVAHLCIIDLQGGVESYNI